MVTQTARAYHEGMNEFNMFILSSKTLYLSNGSTNFTVLFIIKHI